MNNFIDHLLSAYHFTLHRLPLSRTNDQWLTNCLGRTVLQPIQSYHTPCDPPNLLPKHCHFRKRSPVLFMGQSWEEKNKQTKPKLRIVTAWLKRRHCFHLCHAPLSVYQLWGSLQANRLSLAWPRLYRQPNRAHLATPNKLTTVQQCTYKNGGRRDDKKRS